MIEDFLDIYLDDLIAGFPCYSTPRFNTGISASFSGNEKRNRNWLHPLRTFKLPEAVREHPQYEAIADHWLIMGGPERTFPFTDPLDFASVALELANVVPTITAMDQFVGIGDGRNHDFQLKKKYERGGETYTRPIQLPQADSVLISIDGLAPDDPEIPGGPYTFEVSRPGGILKISPAPPKDLEIRAGFLFDVPVRFEADDSFDGIVQSYQVSGFSDLVFIEVRPC